MPALSRFEKAFLAVLGGWAAFALIVTMLGLELASWKANRVLGFVFWTTPLALLFLGLKVRRTAPRIVATASAALLCVVSFLPAACSALDLAFFGFYPLDPSFEPISSTAVEGSELVLYRTNCGAPCHYGLVLRQERTLLPGVRVAQSLANWYPAYSATITVLSPSLVRVQVAWSSNGPNPVTQVVQLRRPPLLFRQ